MRLPVKFTKLVKGKIAKRVLPQETIEQWLHHIADSKIVITDSFHACAFSILFHTDFFVLRNNAGGNTRIESLLSMLNLNDHLVSDVSDIKNVKQINWDQVDSLLDAKRDESLSFLCKQLEKL